MPTDAGYVGPLDLPLSAGGSGGEIDDPAVSALLDLLAFVTKDALDARLANVDGAPTDACPVANRFPYDPFDPRANHVRRPVPGLFVWWDGRDETVRLSQLHYQRARNLRAMYIFPELPSTASLDNRRGLFNAVSAAWVKAAAVDGHISWSYNGKPAGTPLSASWGPVTFGWECLGEGELVRIGIDDANTRPTGRHPSGRDYPAYIRMFRFLEDVEPRKMVTPDDLNGDHDVAIYNDGDHILDRILGAPDGSEQL